MNSVCAYIAGSSGIINQSIVTLKSIKDHNSDVDCMIFLLDLTGVTEEHIAICRKIGITIVGMGEMGRNYIDEFAPFSRWPKETFLYYIAPNWLKSKGYKYAIKLDYDMLCIGEFEYDRIIPECNQVIAYNEKFRRINNYINKEELNKLEGRFNFKLDYSTGTGNNGFFVINLDGYVELKYADIFKKMFIYFMENKIKIHDELIDQFLVGLLQSVMNIRYKLLSNAYNGRPFWHMYNSDWVIIHFNTDIKPWNEYKNFDNLALQYVYSPGTDILRQLLLFNLWREKCDEVGFLEYYSPKPFSSIEIIEMYQKLSCSHLKDIYINRIHSIGSKVFCINNIFDMEDSRSILSVSGMNIAPKNNKYNSFRYDILQKNSIYTITFITGEPRMFFTAGLYDEIEKRKITFNEYITGNKVKFSFFTMDDVEGLCFLIYAGRWGDTVGKSLEIKELNVKVRPIEIK